MDLHGKRILLISPQPWTGLHMSKHHLAQALAARGNTVVFLDPPRNDARGVELRKEGDVLVATYRHWARGVNRLPRALHEWYYRAIIERVGKVSGGPFDVLWCFDTSRMQWFPKGMGYKLLHLADIDILHQGHGLIKEAQLILTVSEAIKDKVLGLGPASAVLDVGHALDERWLSAAQVEGRADRHTPRTVAYAGQMQWDYVDWKAIQEIAGSHPALEFHFYGPYRNDHPDPHFHHVAAMANTRFHGLVDKERLIPALHSADILLLAYRAELAEDQCSNSHKLLEYLSTGNVVVSSNIRAYRDGSTLLVMADQGGELGTCFRNAVHDFRILNAAPRRAERMEFAAKHTYPRLFDRLEKLIPDA